MSSYKLQYFNGRGLAECSRLMFHLAGVAFEDDRIQTSENDRSAWLNIKESMPFGKMPALTVDGTVISQSRAIERFLAKRLGFFGSSELETARIDMAAEQVRDIGADWYSARSDEEKLNGYFTSGLPGHLKYLERFAGDNGFIVGSTFSMDTFSSPCLFEFIRSFLSDLARLALWFPGTFDFYTAEVCRKL